MIYIGIDPGVHTGIAAWCTERQALTYCRTLGILGAIAEIDAELKRRDTASVRLVMEDARLRKYFARADAAQARSGAGIRDGVGSVKRDCGIWTEYAELRGLHLRSVAPAAGATKWDAVRFEKVTGWTGRTSQHARDAALLVVGSK